MWNKCVITVKGFVMLLPGVRQNYLPLQWKLWTSLGFSHMDMILQADAKVDLKEREPDRLICFCSQTQIN